MQVVISTLTHTTKRIATVLGTVALLVFISSCSGRKKVMGEAITERDSMAVMHTRDVVTLISDSGVTRYRITTKDWKVFDRKDPPYWAFEEGIYLEKFDTLFQTEANIEADTAYYYTKKELWKLMGHVEIQNLKGEHFSTSLLYWDQRKEKIYSDRFIRIKQPDRIITGHGFESNQQMTVYTIHQTEGIFYVDENAQQPDTLQAKNDTLQANPAVQKPEPDSTK